MEQQDLINKNKVRSSYFAKRVSDALIILFAAVILISIIIYVLAIYFPPSTFPILDVEATERSRRLFYYMRYRFLPSMIIPSAICIAILTPIRIIIVRRFKIHSTVYMKKDYRHQRGLNKLKKTRDFHDLF